MLPYFRKPSPLCITMTTKFYNFWSILNLVLSCFSTFKKYHLDYYFIFHRSFKYLLKDSTANNGNQQDSLKNQCFFYNNIWLFVYVYCLYILDKNPWWEEAFFNFGNKHGIENHRLKSCGSLNRECKYISSILHEFHNVISSSVSKLVIRFTNDSDLEWNLKFLHCLAIKLNSEIKKINCLP